MQNAFCVYRISFFQVSTLSTADGEKTNGMCMVIRTFTDDAGATSILTAYEDGSVALWETSTWKQVSKLKCHNECVMAMDFHGEINKGFSGSALDTVVQWEISPSRELKLVSEAKLTNPGVSCIKIRPDGKLLALGGWDNQGRVLGSKKMKALAVLSYHSQSVQCLEFLKDNTLVLGSKDGMISFWNVYK